MLTKDWIPFTIGFLAFALAHLIEAATWADWFGGRYRPWFLNSGRAVALTSICLFVVSALVARKSDRYIARALATALGAVTAMAVILFVGGDPGSIFPIVLATGAAVVVAITFAGALASRMFRGR